MRVKYKGYPNYELDIETALLREMQNDMGADGTIERIERELCSTQQVLAKFMAQQIKTLSQLNEVCGYNKYEEVGNE